jgi:hypothetical protein
LDFGELFFLFLLLWFFNFLKEEKERGEGEKKIVLEGKLKNNEVGKFVQW